MAKGTEEFKNTILNYVCNKADHDPLFAAKYGDSKKNIDDCVTYILNYVQKSGNNGFTDDEIFGQAVHYYDEENINVGKSVNATVVVNHAIILTEEEQKQAREKAIENFQEGIANNLIGKKSKTVIKKDKPTSQELSLFD